MSDDPDREARFDQLVEALTERGHLTEHHRKILARVRARKRLPVVLGSTDPHVKESDVDCRALFPICRARCCAFKVALTEDEVRAGHVRWNVHSPYHLEKDPSTGLCVHQGSNGACTKYEVRPDICRRYDCRSDRRIWLDFDAKIPAPMLEGVEPPEPSEPPEPPKPDQ